MLPIGNCLNSSLQGHAPHMVPTTFALLVALVVARVVDQVVDQVVERAADQTAGPDVVQGVQHH